MRVRLDKFPLSRTLTREFVRPNSLSVENFRALSLVYHRYKYTRYTAALPIAVDFQPAAAHCLSKYRLALRATLLVWPRTSHNFSWSLYPIRCSSLSLFLLLSLSRFTILVFSSPSLPLLRETHPSYTRRPVRRTRANPPASTLLRRVFQALHPGFTSCPDGAKIWSTLASPRLKVIACALTARQRSATPLDR